MVAIVDGSSPIRLFPEMLSPRNGLGLEAKNYGLGLCLGLVASGLGLGLSFMDAVASASTVWPRGRIVL